MSYRGLASPGLALVIAAAVISLAGCDGGPSTGADLGAAPASSSEPAPSTATGGSATSRLTLGPLGVGPIRLGMTRSEIEQTGAAKTFTASRHDGWPRGCKILFYNAKRLGRTPGDTLNGVVSARHGLEQLHATTRMLTPAGIGIGSTLKEVEEAYGRSDLRHGDLVTVPATANYVYQIQIGRVVRSVSLQRKNLDCIR